MIDRVACADFARKGQVMFMYIYRNDRVEPAIFAAIKPDNPTAPTPKTAKLSPARGFMTLRTGRTGLPAAGECADMFDRRIGAYLYGEASIGDREISEEDC